MSAMRKDFYANSIREIGVRLVVKRATDVPGRMVKVIEKRGRSGNHDKRSGKSRRPDSELGNACSSQQADEGKNRQSSDPKCDHELEPTDDGTRRSSENHIRIQPAAGQKGRQQTDEIGIARRAFLSDGLEIFSQWTDNSSRITMKRDPSPTDDGQRALHDEQRSDYEASKARYPRGLPSVVDSDSESSRGPTEKKVSRQAPNMIERQSSRSFTSGGHRRESAAHRRAMTATDETPQYDRAECGIGG